MAGSGKTMHPFKSAIVTINRFKIKVDKSIPLRGDPEKFEPVESRFSKDRFIKFTFLKIT